MELSRPELHASGFHALLREADRTFGAQEVDATLVALGVTRAGLKDAEAWFSLEFAEAWMGRLAALDAGLIALAPAEMAHTKCIARGDEACIYDVRWRELTRRQLRHWTMLAGLGAALAVFGVPPPWTFAYVTSCAGLMFAGYLAGAVLEL